MHVFELFALGFLIVCAVSVCLTKNLLASLIIYMSYSMMMSVVWILLRSPDLALTEAAVGAGITSILLFITLGRVNAIRDKRESKEKGGRKEQRNPKLG